VAADPSEPRYDVPWIVMDSTATEEAFGWRVDTPLQEILEEIARHAEAHPDWLEISQA
jgi:CDP-paratose 2-epimerase